MNFHLTWSHFGRNWSVRKQWEPFEIEVFSCSRQHQKSISTGGWQPHTSPTHSRHSNRESVLWKKCCFGRMTTSTIFVYRWDGTRHTECVNSICIYTPPPTLNNDWLGPTQRKRLAHSKRERDESVLTSSRVKIRAEKWNSILFSTMWFVCVQHGKCYGDWCESTNVWNFS